MQEPIEEAIIAAFSGVSVATIGHILWEGFLDHRRIKPMQRETRIIGAAVTLRLPTSDSSLLHFATGQIRPGEILVIDRAGDQRLACLGGNVAMALSLAGAAGAIVDGPICDPDEIREHGLPIWCDGVSPITTRRSGPAGSLNARVQCGGVLVSPGDLIVADESGVVCIPRSDAMDVAKAACAKEQNGIERRAQMQAGKTLGELSGATKLINEHAQVHS